MTFADDPRAAYLLCCLTTCLLLALQTERSWSVAAKCQCVRFLPGAQSRSKRIACLQQGWRWPVTLHQQLVFAQKQEQAVISPLRLCDNKHNIIINACHRQRGGSLFSTVVLPACRCSACVCALMSLGGVARPQSRGLPSSKWWPAVVKALSICSQP